MATTTATASLKARGGRGVTTRAQAPNSVVVDLAFGGDVVFAPSPLSPRRNNTTRRNNRLRGQQSIQPNTATSDTAGGLKRPPSGRTISAAVVNRSPPIERQREEMRRRKKNAQQWNHNNQNHATTVIDVDDDNDKKEDDDDDDVVEIIAAVAAAAKRPRIRPTAQARRMATSGDVAIAAVADGSKKRPRVARNHAAVVAAVHAQRDDHHRMMMKGRHHNNNHKNASPLVQQVLEILPNAFVPEIERLAIKYGGNMESIVTQLLTTVAVNDPSDEVMDVSSHDDGEQQQENHNDTNVAKPAAAHVPMAVDHDPRTGVTQFHREQRTAWKYDFMAVDSEGDRDENKNSKSLSFSPTEQYLQQAQTRLFQDFPFLSKDGAKQILRNQEAHSGRRHFAVAHHVILQAIRTGHDNNDEDQLSKEYQLVKDALDGRPLNEKQKINLNKLGSSTTKQPVILKRSRKTSSLSCFLKSPKNDDDKENESDHDRKPAAKVTDVPVVTHEILVEEIEFVRQTVQEWWNATLEHLKRKRNQKKAQESQTGMECQCCFDTFLVEDMCNCRDEGHLFCVDCLHNYAKTQIFGQQTFGMLDPETKRPAMELLCFQGECKSGFPRDILEKALPRPMLEKYDQLQFEIAVKSAQLANLMSCPKCEFPVQLDTDATQQPKFVCPMDDCKQESCRLCRLPWHGNDVSCDEARRRENAQKGRHGVEEALTLAKVRSCPKCQKAFLKESGCNKITCSGCRTISCYVCRQVITKEEGYAHFCQTPHCEHKRCGKCRLWTANEDEEDEKAMRRAGLEAAAALEQNQTIVDQLLNNNNDNGKKKGILKKPRYGI